VILISERRLRKLWHGVFTLTGQKVVIINTDYVGLGNRLKFLAVYHAHFGLENTRLFWNRTGWVNRPLSDIFAIEGIPSLKEYSIPPNPLLPPIMCHPSKPRFHERGFWRFDVDDDLPEEYFIERHGRRFPAVDFLFDRTPEKYLAKYRPFFPLLKPSAAVARRVGTVPVTDDHVCVQVRNTVDKGDLANPPSLSSFIDRMHCFPARTTFFISCMDASFAAIFHREFGERVLELPGKNYRSMVDAAADLVLLSRGGTLVYSQGSSFGEVPWWLGGCRQDVVEIPQAA
jgi:hypothetical protein